MYVGSCVVVECSSGFFFAIVVRCEPSVSGVLVIGESSSCGWWYLLWLAVWIGGV